MKKYLRFLVLPTLVYSALAFANPNTISLGVISYGKTQQALAKEWKPEINSIQSALRRPVQINDIDTAGSTGFELIGVPNAQVAFYKQQGYEVVGQAKRFDPITNQLSGKSAIRLLARSGVAKQDFLVSTSRFGIIRDQNYPPAEALQKWLPASQVKRQFIPYANTTLAVAALKRGEIDGLPVKAYTATQYPDVASFDIGSIEGGSIMAKKLTPKEIEATKAALTKGPFHDDIQKYG